MLGKALLATILGAGVTGGAVYLAQHPEVINKPSVSAPVNQSEVEQENTSEAISSDEVNPTNPDQTETQVVPVLPKSEQLTVQRPVDPAIDASSTPSEVTAAPDETTATLIAQAKQIQSPDLRDQAYLGVVDYALFTDDYGSAIEAMEALQQPQLRDTARANIAVKYAKSGATEKAFAIIEQVEIDELRDFMRLQVIDAMTNGQE